MCSCFKIYDKEIMIPSEYDARKARKAKKAPHPTYAWTRPVSSLSVPSCYSCNGIPFPLPLFCHSYIITRPSWEFGYSFGYTEVVRCWPVFVRSSLAEDVFSKLLHTK